MSAFTRLAELERTRIWPGVIGRVVKGLNLTVAIVELEPGSLVPEHHHPQEQIGFVIEGTITCRCAGEERELRPGGIYRFVDDSPHEIRAAAEGAIVADLFAPSRDDWDALERMGPAEPGWPHP